MRAAAHAAAHAQRRVRGAERCSYLVRARVRVRVKLGAGFGFGFGFGFGSG